MEENDESIIPNPKCPQCKGTGKIPLFTSIVKCECRDGNEDEDIRMYDTDINCDVYWE